METIILKDRRVVFKKDYITAKTKDLKSFGYKGLTEKEVAKQLENILNKKKLSVIGILMENDIDKSAQ